MRVAGTRVLGMISGTSHDGIDAAVVDFSLDGELLTGTIVQTSSTPYRPELRARLVAALPPAATTFAEVCELDTLIGQAFADAAARVIASSGPVDVIVSHGQTVFHWVDTDHAQGPRALGSPALGSPALGSRALGTLQIGQPAWIAELTGVPVISDVRIRDITAGGHGAPLVSYLDRLILGRIDGIAAALNLGGIANVTVLRGDEITAWDIGPANTLVDAVVSTLGLTEEGFDVDGRIAASGQVSGDLLDALLDDPYYRLEAPKSTGKEHFNGAYVDAAVARFGKPIEPADLVATLTELTARTVARDVLAADAATVLVSGGGCRNPTLLASLRAALPGVRVLLTDDVGVPTDDKEAVAFALIGWCTMHGLPGTVLGGTGARAARVLGTITPGAAPLSLPAPLATAPSSIRITGSGA